MSWFWAVLAAVLLFDVVRLRGRLAKLVPLSHHDAPDASATARVVAPPDQTIPADIVRDVGEHLRSNGLQAVDLVPRNLPALRAMALAHLVDVPHYRSNRLAHGYTSGHAFVVEQSLLAKIQKHMQPPADAIGMIAWAKELKRHAPVGMDMVVAPGLTVAPEQVRARGSVMRAVLGSSTPGVLAVQGLLYVILLVGAILPHARPWGWLALLVFHLQPAFATVGTPLRPRDLAIATLLRLPIELRDWLVTIAGARASKPSAEQSMALRRSYEPVLANPPEQLLEARRDSCPLCHGTRLRKHMNVPDLLQHKPGRFTLERCRDCGHIFQNPRLSIAGLDFYYKDFYDGLGEEGMDFVFGYSDASYVGRAKLLASHALPERWLDVGAGHGHFCCVARDILPNTSFDGLDLTHSIETAQQRGWIDRAWKGLFPELASQLTSTYDVVSMHHYLEHTLDPRAEIAAAHTALREHGWLLIEVPDPQSPLGRLLGRYWIPWFQPQHQHFLSVANAERLLREHGFEPVTWQRGEAHQPVDFLFAAMMFFGRLAPPTDVPWRPAASWPLRAWSTVVWTIAVPFLVVGRVLDAALEPLVRRLGGSNTYRVLARKSLPRSMHAVPRVSHPVAVEQPTA